MSISLCVMSLRVLALLLWLHAVSTGEHAGQEEKQLRLQPNQAKQRPCQAAGQGMGSSQFTSSVLNLDPVCMCACR